MEKVKVVKEDMYRDGGTIEYKDIHNRRYFVPAKAYNLEGIYSCHPGSIRSKGYFKHYLLLDIELEIVDKFE